MECVAELLMCAKMHELIKAHLLTSCHIWHAVYLPLETCTLYHAAWPPSASALSHAAMSDNVPPDHEPATAAVIEAGHLHS